jgi:hypothetical protein
MEDFQQQWCRNVMLRLSRGSLNQLISDPPDDFHCTITIPEITDKLHSGAYISVLDWALDVSYLLHDLIDAYDDSAARSASVRTTLQWFEARLLSYPRAPDDEQRRQFGKTSKGIADVLLVLRAALDAQQPPEPTRPHAARMPPPCVIQDAEFETLRRRIGDLDDPEVLLRIYALLRETMPELEISDTTVIERSMISRKCLKSLKHILSKSAGGQ